MSGIASESGALIDWQERIRAAAADGVPLRIAGAGSKDFYGEAGAGERFETLAHAGIVDYDPTELVVTARCGTPLDTLERVLEGERQMLGFEPPRFGGAGAGGLPASDDSVPEARGTVGGCVATGLAGPRRPYAGSVRDLVLGVHVIDGRGEALAFGGKVMKNVAGFDVSRMMTGALGTLGVIVEVSFKCLPLPGMEVTRTYELASGEALRTVNEWSARPLPLSATCWHAGRLYLRLSGSAPAVDAAVRRLGGEPFAEGPALWRALRDHTHPFLSAPVAPGRSLWRLSVAPTAPELKHEGEQLIEWGGALRWLFAPETMAETLRAWAATAGGHATVFRSMQRHTSAFHPLAPAMGVIHRRLKSVFDPAGILNPGRMYADL